VVDDVPLSNSNKIIPDLYATNPQVLVITADHSTPCPLKGHSWYPAPLLIVTKTGERDGLPFYEKNCVKGSVKTMFSRDLMSLVLAHALKLDKYGA
jgi:2,3-bisphosphoglycerate-independent phosphoglycerate mutase